MASKQRSSWEMPRPTSKKDKDDGSRLQEKCSSKEHASNIFNQVCPPAVLIGFLLGALVASIAFATILTFYLTDTGTSTSVTTIRAATPTLASTISSNSTTTTTTSTIATCSSVVTISACATWNQTGTTIAGKQNGLSGSNLSSLNLPVDIFVDSSYTVFISDGNNNRIVKYYANATSGILVAGDGIAGSNSSQLNLPKGIAVDLMGDVIVVDSSNYRIQNFSSGSMIANTVITNSSINPLGLLRDLQIDCNNNLYLTDSGNNRIVKFYSNNATGVYIAGDYGTGSAANQLSTPYGIFIDQNQTVYVADYGNHRIQMWLAGATSGSTVAGVTGASSSSLGYLSNPQAVVVDNNGNIYIADTGNNRIVKWTTNYTAGGVCIAGCTNTSGSASNQLNHPRDLKFDSIGNLYVSEQNNNRVQKLSIQLPTSNCSLSG